jgi:hypothetical protein
MHLLNTTTFKLKEFYQDKMPNYAILSHKWDDTEISFQDLQHDDYSSMTGFAKIKGCCAQAAKDGWEYVWIDSCCINKTSSAELSEAINSMFRWYRNAQICYVYLSDVPVKDEDPQLEGSAFRKSKWFERGWTLQELLAPSKVIFFNQDWAELGTRSSLSELISSITGSETLVGFEEACVAQKMSWASRRKTTRKEDEAYCLMGLFGVHMPPLYGEGPNAFLRLQLEILSMVDDESIFAWKLDGENTGGLLASSPAAFKDSGSYRRITAAYKEDRPAFSMTNKGLRIDVSLFRLDSIKVSAPESGWNDYVFCDTWLAPINCKKHYYFGHNKLYIILKRVARSESLRLNPGLISWHELNKGQREQIQRTHTEYELAYVRQDRDVGFYEENRHRRKHCILISNPTETPGDFYITDWAIDPRCRGHGEKTDYGLKLNLSKDGDNIEVYSVIEGWTTALKRFMLIIYVHVGHRAGVDILIPPQEQSLKHVEKSLWRRRTKPLLYVGQDPISTPLGSGVSVSLAAWEGMVEGEKQTHIEVRTFEKILR